MKISDLKHKGLFAYRHNNRSFVVALGEDGKLRKATISVKTQSITTGDIVVLSKEELDADDWECGVFGHIG